MIHITDSKTDRILDYIQEDEFWDDKHYKSLKDTLETFDFITFADKRFSEYLAERNRIIIPDEGGKYVEFVIENTRTYHGVNGLSIEVYTSATYIELAKAKVINPQTTPAWTPKQHVDFALAGTDWEAGDIHFTGVRSLTIDKHTNPFAYLKRLATEFDLELHFRVGKDGNKIVRRYVDLLERVGVWRGREAEFGKDLIGIERKVDLSNISTALIGLGPVREDGTRLEVFVEDKDALARWGRNNQHIIDIYEPQSTDLTMTEERLRKLTQNELDKRINSVVEYKADIVDLEKVPGLENEQIRFGDTIKIKDTMFNPPLYLEARVHTQERSIKTDGTKKVTLGDYIEYTEEDVLAIWKSLQAEIAKKVSMSDVTEVVYTKPEVDSKDADVYQDSTYYADNVSETKKQEAIQVAATDATNKANQAENNAKSHANLVAEQKKQEAINAAIADADAKLNAAKTELEADIALKADAEWVNGQLVLKENAITKSNTAPANPTTGQLWLDTSVTPNVLKRWSGSAWVKASPTSAGEVGAYTKTEVDNALNSKVSVTQYNADINGIVTQIDDHESRITQTENEIATKVSNTTYQQDKTALENDISSLETRMTNAETAITQNANQIALKANKTEVYTKTEIDGQFSTVNQQISQLDAELSIQADQIATKVSRTELQTAIDGIQVGGDNLIYNSVGLIRDATNTYASGWANGTYATIQDGYNCLEVRTSSSSEVTKPSTQIKVKPNTKYTVSFKVKGTANSKGFDVFFLGSRTEKTGIGSSFDIIHHLKAGAVSANFTEYVVTFTTNADEVSGYIRIDNNGSNDGQISSVYFAELIMQEGTKVTKWTPSSKDAQSQIDGLGSRMTTAETSIIQLANQIQLKANQTTVDSLTNRISSAESTITLLSDEIELKVDKDGVIAAINVSPETIKLSANKINLDGFVEAKHIKSLNGLNVNDQFVVDSNGNVKMANDRVTIDRLGIKVKEADFLTEDARSGVVSKIIPMTNMIIDHSFELIQGGAAFNSNYYNIDYSPIWNLVGSPKVTATSLGTDVTPFSIFGHQSVLVNSTNHVVNSHTEVKAGQTYTISAFFRRGYGYGTGTPKIRVRIVDYPGLPSEVVQFEQIYTAPSPVPADYSVVRHSFTFTVPSNITWIHPNTAFEVYIYSSDGTWVEADGVQLVEGTYPTLYNDENSLWRALTGQIHGGILRLSEVFSTIIKANYNGYTMLFDHSNGNVSLSAAGGDLYLGYYNTNKIYTSKSFRVNPTLEVTQDILLGGTTTSPNGRFIADGTYLYIQTKGTEARVVNTYTTATFKPIRASNFITDTSIRENKKDIEEFEDSALEGIRNAKVYTYRRKTDEPDAFKQLGLMVDETPRILHGPAGDSFDLYALTAYTIKGVKELDSKFMSLEDEVNWLKIENQLLKQKIQQLEAKIA